MPETATATSEDLGRYMVVSLHPVQPESGKTRRWHIRNRNSGATLGVVEWYGAWRQYIFTPQQFADIVLAASCLDDIARFLERMNAEQKGKKA